jgi:hypothetical protein
MVRISYWRKLCYYVVKAMNTRKTANSHAKCARNRAIEGFTRLELIVVVVVLLMIISVAVLLPHRRVYVGATRISCINNLKQIGIAYRIWANDNGGQIPSLAANLNGGWNELLSGNNPGRYCWMNYATMSNELGLSPRILACPSDERAYAAEFMNITNNDSLSYFVGVQADANHPSWLLGGDRNLAAGTVPKKDYGFSPTDGKGNDVIIKGPVCWSLEMHSLQNPGGAGNILLGDGSAQQVQSSSAWKNWIEPELKEAAKATNSPGMRLIFP